MLLPCTRDSTDAVVVDADYKWREITSETPKHCKLQLINSYYGVAVYGMIRNLSNNHFTHWAPLPTFDKPITNH